MVKNAYFRRFIWGNERISERSYGINKDLGPFQRDCQFLFLKNNHLCPY